MKKLLPILFLTLVMSTPVLADATGLGSVASNLMEPVSILSDFVVNGSLVVGIMFIFGSVIKYGQHRRNPLAVPISNVVFIFICGILLLLLPLAYKVLYEAPPSKTVSPSPIVNPSR